MHPLRTYAGSLRERNGIDVRVLGGTQARAIGHAQGGLVFEPGRTIEQRCHFLRAEHRWQMNVVCSTMPCRPSVTRKKKRSVDTV
jgi:hypothetical protein